MASGKTNVTRPSSLQSNQRLSPPLQPCLQPLLPPTLSPASRSHLSTQTELSPQPAAPQSLGILLNAASSLKSSRSMIPLPPPPHSTQGSSWQALLGFKACCPDPHFSTYFGCNYMFTDLFPIIGSSETQYALNRNRQGNLGLVPHEGEKL